MNAAAVEQPQTNRQAVRELPKITGSGLRQLVHVGPTARAFWVESRGDSERQYAVRGDHKLVPEGGDAA